MKVLVVDDSLTMRKIVSKALGGLAVSEIVQAVDGADALEKTKEHSDIELILCDWNMPNMTGYEFLVEFRKDASKKDVGFIMVTTEAEKESVIKAVKAGANNYVLKPFTPDGLIQKINQTLQKLGKTA